ncbi:MAG: heparinase II/III family protein [Gammaproteobacteria bacterium]
MSIHPMIQAECNGGMRLSRCIALCVLTLIAGGLGNLAIAGAATDLMIEEVNVGRAPTENPPAAVGEQPAILWPREQARYANPADVDLFVTRGEVKIISTLGTFRIPDDPTWAEDPFNSRSWALYYDSLGWLYVAEEAYKTGRFPSFPDYLKHIVIDFLSDNHDPTHPTHPMVWHDGGNAFRLANLSYFYYHYFRAGNADGVVIALTPAEQQLFADGLRNHRDQVLYQLGRVEHWADSNHRFFHAMALSTYASVFGAATATPYFEANADALLAQGLAVIDSILSTIVDLDAGVTREQSFTYHRLDLGLLLETKQAILDQGYALAHDYIGAMERMLEFDLLSERPGTAFAEGYSTEVGDTGYGTRAGTPYTDAVRQLGLISPHAAYLLSKGAQGVRPPDLIDYSAAGYIIARPQYAWENPRDTRVLFDVSEQRVSHGHFDNTNVLLSAFGQRILVDSGGPYSYDQKDLGYTAPFHDVYLETSKAHNVLVVNDASFDTDTQVLAVRDSRDYSFMAAAHDGYPGIHIRRYVLVLKDGVLVVLDVADNPTGQPENYQLNWHFPPTASGVSASAANRFTVGPVRVNAVFAASGDETYQVISGRLGNDPQGWVTPALYQITAAPVLKIAQTSATASAWFASAFAPSLNTASSLQMSISQYSDGFHLRLALPVEGLSWLARIGVDGSVNVTKSGLALALVSSTVAGCKTTTGTVTLGAPAPAGGAQIALSDTLAAAITPATITIPAGATSGQFTVSTTPVAAAVTGAITAGYAGGSASQALKIRPMGLQAFALAPNPVVGPATVTATASLECAAAPDAITVALASSNTAVATTPASIVIPAGATDGTFVISAADVAVRSTTIIKASANAISKSLNLTVNP